MIYDRWLAEPLREMLQRPYVHVLFGARQTGKSTLLNTLLPTDAVRIDLANPEDRTRYLAHPGDFVGMCRALPEDPRGRFVFVDEIQTVPALFDAVQHLYDADKERWRFVLCGSSARKLRHGGANLLPGRCFLHRLHPLIMAEHSASTEPGSSFESPLSLQWPNSLGPEPPFPPWNLEQRLAYGALPGIVSSDEADRSHLLKAFSTVHLEEEVRREASVRDLGAFLRFLAFAAQASGEIINFAAISRETGVSLPTVKSYYQVLEDMFVGFRVTAYTKSRRKNLLSTPRFFFFDLGVRHAAAGLTPSIDVVRADPGNIFEQWVGIELWKRLQYLGKGTLHYQRTRDGAEVDFVVELDSGIIPIEVKWTENPLPQDARHVITFLKERSEQAGRGYVVCRCPHPMEIHEKVVALPWFCL